MTTRTVKVKGEQLSFLAHADSAEQLLTGTDTGDNGTAGENFKVKGTYLYWTDNNGDVRRKEGTLTGGSRTKGNITVKDDELYYGDDDGDERSATQAGSLIIRPDGDVSNALLLFPDSGEDPYQNIDEVVADDDTTYLYWENGTTAYKTGRFTAAAPSSTPGTIVSVEIHARIKHTTGVGSETARLYVGTVAGSQTFGQVSVAKDNSYAEYSSTFTTSPTTSVAWTWAEIDDLMIGVALRAQGAGKKCSCTQLWAVVNFG